MIEYQATLDAVGRLIRDTAERYILPRYTRLRPDEVLTKSKGEVVTVVDREVEAQLTAGLARIAPDARIVGEEGVEAGHCALGDLYAESCWLIDPLDGTANFAAGAGPFGVMVALLRRGETAMGWLYDPVSGIMSTAVAGHGAQIDGRAVTVAAPPRTRRIATLATQFMTPEQRDRVRGIAARTMDLAPIPRCAAAHYPMLVHGVHDLAVFQRTLPWDHAAGALLLTEAGGCVTRSDGRAYRPDEPGTAIVAAGTQAGWTAGIAALGTELTAIGAPI